MDHYINGQNKKTSTFTFARSGYGVGGTDTLNRQFTYDPLYRLTSATGRENVPSSGTYPFPGWNDTSRSTDNNSTTSYTRKYTYDKLGNIEQIKQMGTNAFTRVFNYTEESGVKIDNKLESVTVGGNSYTYNYDEVGNQKIVNTERKFEWDAANRLLFFKNQIGTNEPSIEAQYLYDHSGNRVKKIVRKQGGGYEIRIYIDGVFEYFTDETDEQNTVHIMDDKSRIATIRIGPEMGDSTPAVKYVLDNNIGSSMVTLDGSNGDMVNEQEYYPFGETSFGSYSKKRYQYVGKERDEESGMYYYGARYYSPWIGRFFSVDPMKEKRAWLTPYNYVQNNPIRNTDPTGALDDGGGDPPAMNQDGTLKEANEPVKISIDLLPKTEMRSLPESKKIVEEQPSANKKELNHDNKVERELKNPESAENNMSQKSGLGFEYDSLINEPDALNVKETLIADQVPFREQTKTSDPEAIEKPKPAAALKLDINKAVKHLNSNAQSGSVSKCATYVREALNAGGLETPNNPVHAKNYKAYLADMGFEVVEARNLSNGDFSDFIMGDYTPQVGDIAVFESFTVDGKTRKSGHIQMWNGSQWVSDFKQTTFWAGPPYRKGRPNFVIYRKPST